MEVELLDLICEDGSVDIIWEKRQWSKQTGHLIRNEKLFIWAEDKPTWKCSTEHLTNNIAEVTTYKKYWYEVRRLYSFQSRK